MKIVPVMYADKRKLLKGAVNGFLQRTVTVPLSQEKDHRCTSIVKKGDIVREGQVIAVPEDADASLVAKIHSPVPGTIEDIILCNCPDGRQEEAVKIKMAGEFSYLGKKQKDIEWSSLTPAEVLHSIAEGGIINTFNTAEPVSLASDIDSRKKNKSKLLIVRLYDEDPSRVTDSLIASLYIDDVYAGAMITAYALEADGIVLVTDMKSELPKIHESADVTTRSVKINTAEYPAGFSKEIRKAVRKNLKDKPFSQITEDDLYTDASTMVDVCDAVQYGIPVVNKFVYVSGDCIPASGLLKVKIGTSIRFLAEQCGGFIRPPAAVIVNGLIRGTSAGSLDTPVTKYVKSVYFLPSSKLPDQRQSVCMHCGNCRRVCPRKLSPDILYRHVSGGMPADDEYISSAVLCSFCSLCNSVCPARLPISQAVKMLRKQVIQMNKEVEK